VTRGVLGLWDVKTPDPGTVTIKETADGLEFDTNLKGLPPGEHGFHVHEKGTCAVADKDGTPTAGQAAGGHYDPEGTNAHRGRAVLDTRATSPRWRSTPRGTPTSS